MADPVSTEIAGGLSSTATTTVSLPAQPAGTLLILSVASDDYRTTSGTGRPESTGWTYLNGQQGNLGFYVWWKLTDGTETSVQYRIGSNAASAHTLIAATSIDAAPLGVTNTNASGVVTNLTSHTTAAVTPATGSRWLVVACVGSTGNSTSGPYTWSGAFAKRSERYVTSGYRPGTTVGTVLTDGGSSLTSTITFASATQVNQGMSVVAAFKVASGTPDPPKQGSASGAISWAGSAVGRKVAAGVAAGTLAFTGTASGSTPRQGSTMGGVAWLGTATGAAPSVSGASGSAAGTLAWTGTATGMAPTVGSKSGSATGALSWVGEATGERTSSGTATGGTLWMGSATGQAPAPGQKAGTAAGVLTWAGTATGATERRGQAAGTLTWAGGAIGYTTSAGTATGATDWHGLATGVEGTGFPLLTPPARTLTVTAEDRALTVTREDRTLRVPAENRTVEA